MQNPLIATFTIFFVSALISVVANRITDVIDKVILKRKENRRIEKQKKDWDNNQISFKVHTPRISPFSEKWRKRCHHRGTSAFYFRHLYI